MMLTERKVVYRAKGNAARLWRCTEPEILADSPARCGKSRVIGELMLRDAIKHPGSRQAVVRETRASLTESFMQNFEDHVLADGVDRTYLDVPLSDGPQRGHRHAYDFKNGSTIVLAGMDNPTRMFSTEWDRIYVQEAIELSLDEWEKLNRGLTNKKIPHPDGPDPETGERRFLAQLIGDTNPDAPEHWLNRRCESGKTHRIKFTHADNPSLTRQDIERLSNLTGVRRQRLFEGLWVSSEGAIWPEWNRPLHVLPRMPNVKIVRHIAAQDWGYTAAGVLLVAAQDDKGRLYIRRQIYQSGRKIDWWVDQALPAKVEFRFQSIQCDPSRPEYIDSYRSKGLPAQEADNAIEGGLDSVRDRLAPASDGVPRLFVIAGSVQERDQGLLTAERPTCLEDEIPSYVYAKSADGTWIKEVPADRQDDHACDALRYLCRYADRLHVEERKEIPKYGAGTFGQVLGMNEADEGTEN